MANTKSEMMPSARRSGHSQSLEYKLGAPCWAHSGDTNRCTVLVISAVHSTLRTYSEEIIKDEHIDLCSRIIYRYR